MSEVAEKEPIQAKQSSRPLSNGEFLLERGWTPIGCNAAGVEMWEPPSKGWSYRDKEVEIDNLPKVQRDGTMVENKDKPKQKFKRRVVTGPATMPFTTLQAVHAERQKKAG